MSGFSYRAAACLVAAGLAAGCGGAGAERRVVSGEVSYNGRPVEDGEIRFFPAAGTDAPMSGAYIRGGRYTAEGLGGVPVGTFRVEIVGHRGTRPADGVDVEKQGSGGQYLPARFNTRTTLEATVPPGTGPVTRDFHLTD